jgi:hypothetical protein
MGEKILGIVSADPKNVSISLVTVKAWNDAGFEVRLITKDQMNKAIETYGI